MVKYKLRKYVTHHFYLKNLNVFDLSVISHIWRKHYVKKL